MAECAECGCTTGMPYSCNECDGTYCSDHRLPEAHSCYTTTLTAGDDSEPEIPPPPEPVPDDGGESADRPRQSGGDFFSSIATIVLLPLIVLYYILTSRVVWAFAAIVTVAAVAGLVTTGGVAVPAVDAPEIPSGADDSGDAPPAASATTATATAPASASDTSVDVDALEDAIHERVNAVREERGLPRLDRRSGLDDVAAAHSLHMASAGFFSHTAPNGSTREDRYNRAGLSCLGGENLFTTRWEGFDQTSGELAEASVEQWMASAGHRENLLREAFTEHGLGVSVVEDPPEGGTRIYVTQNFCR